MTGYKSGDTDIRKEKKMNVVLIVMLVILAVLIIGTVILYFV